MRGKIDVTSELNKGTTFTIKIPVLGEYKDKTPSQVYNNDRDQNQEEQSGSSVERIKHKKRSSRKMKLTSENEDLNVLLFQKDEIMTKLFKKYLQKHKIQFKFSTNFKDLLRSFRVKLNLPDLQ